MSWLEARSESCGAGTTLLLAIYSSELSVLLCTENNSLRRHFSKSHILAHAQHHRLRLPTCQPGVCPDPVPAWFDTEMGLPQCFFWPGDSAG